MKHFLSLISSTRTMIILLMIFAISIAMATFIENDFGTDAARAVVYNATWFEILLFIGMVNIIAVVIKHRMYQRSKLTLFLFHLAFVIIILGSGVTRYFGREGTMSIREGQVSRIWFSTETHLGVMLEQENSRKYYSWPVLFSGITGNHFSKKISFAGHELRVKTLHFIPHAVQTIQYSDHGEPYLNLVTTSGQGREEYMLTPGQNMKTPLFDFQFTVLPDSAVTEGLVRVFDKGGLLYFIAPFSVERTMMGNNTTETLPGYAFHEFFPGMLHNFQGIPMVVKQYMPSARISAQPDDNPESQNLSALEVEVTCDGKNELLTVWGMKDQPGNMVDTKINGLEIGLNYGSVMKELPFSLRLNDFIIERYPGSESPSWFESNVQLIDKSAGIDREERIYMNHILKHRGYRFYQSSYDLDEKGTVLSLNRDGPGTSISYLGYLLMGLGMLLSLLNSKSRFSNLSRMSSAISKKSLIIGFLILTLPGLQAQPSPDSLPEIPMEIASDFSEILVQDNGGRIEPVSTLSSEILRKIARKENYKGQTPDQVLLGMIVYPEQWQHEAMIRVGHERIQQELGITSKYASFVDFFRTDSYSGYSLRSFVEEAYRKKPAYRTKFDNEIIRVDERLNIAYLVYTGAIFRFFPAPDDASNTWYSPLSSANAFSGEDSVFTAHILTYFSEEAQKAMAHGDWKLNREMLKAIKLFQNTYGDDIIPAKSRIHAEILYNKLDLFKRITRIYLLVGLILLLIQFVHIFIPKFSIKYYLIPAVVIIILAFTAHTISLALRWYVSGHAPWSNGYEALTFISWTGILAGLIFSRKSSITVSASAILAALILQTAHLSWMDPQITNLVPVLKSYWLVVHVAVITASYSFLGLGALVALINLIMMFFENQRNKSVLEDHINKLTYITEMTLIAGLYLLTIGTFLGGIWANESWGRYWAWDPKETWALVTVIVYAIVVHLRLVPGMRGRLAFNILALGGFASVLMTYFGVNYYLSGLHSYAKGDPVPVPPILYYSVTVFIILSLLAGINQFRLAKILKH